MLHCTPPASGCSPRLQALPRSRTICSATRTVVGIKRSAWTRLATESRRSGCARRRERSAGSISGRLTIVGIGAPLVVRSGVVPLPPGIRAVDVNGRCSDHGLAGLHVVRLGIRRATVVGARRHSDATAEHGDATDRDASSNETNFVHKGLQVVDYYLTNAAQRTLLTGLAGIRVSRR